MNEYQVELFLQECLSEICCDIITFDSPEFLFHNIKPEFIISQLAKKLVDKEQELAQLLF